MKTVDVKIGATYLCRVGDRLVAVVVTERHPGTMRNSGRRSPDTFTVHRVGEQRYLPKQRTAAALRPILEASVQEARTALVNTLEGIPEPTRPSDYEPCGDCGFDHGYEQDEAAKTHTALIGAVQVSSLEELGKLDDPALPHEPSIPSDCPFCDEPQCSYGRALDETANLLTPQPPTVPPTEPNPPQTGIIVSQEYYLSAAENRIGWCTTCRAFRGEELEPDSRECECPECHRPTLYGAELALTAGLINPQEDSDSKPFWRCESCGHEDHSRAMPPDRQAFYAGNRPKWLTVCPRCKSDDFTPVGY